MRYNPENPDPAWPGPHYDPELLLRGGGFSVATRIDRRGEPDAWAVVVVYVSDRLEDARRAVRAGDTTREDEKALLDWVQSRPGLTQRWGQELHTRARELLRPWRDLLAEAQREGHPWPPPPAAADEAALAAGYPVEVALVLGALTAETRAAVLDERIPDRPAEAHGRERWRRLAAAWRWLGVDPEPGGYAENPETYGPDPEPGSPYLIPGLFWRDTEEPPRFLRALVRDLWAARWRDEADRVRRKPAALVVPVHEGVGAFLGTLHTRPADPRQLPLPIPGLVQAPGAVALGEALHRLAQSGGAAVLAHRIVRSLVGWGATVHAVGEGHRVPLAPGVEGQRTAGGVVELWVEGGLDGLREAVGSRSKNDAPRAVLDTLAAGTVGWATDTAWGRSPLLTWREDRATAGRPAMLRLLLGELLLPGVASAAGVSPRDRVLVPVLPAPVLPRGPRLVAGALALDWALTRDLADRRHELRKHGSVALDPVAVGREIGVGALLVDACMELWLDPETGRWTSPEPGRLRLVDRGPEGEALRLLIEGAERSEAARARVARRRR